jgi:hypothetical protein
MQKLLIGRYYLFEFEDTDESCQLKDILDVIIDTPQYDLAACRLSSFHDLPGACDVKAAHERRFCQHSIFSHSYKFLIISAKLRKKSQCNKSTDMFFGFSDKI